MHSEFVLLCLALNALSDAHGALKNCRQNYSSVQNDDLLAFSEGTNTEQVIITGTVFSLECYFRVG